MPRRRKRTVKDKEEHELLDHETIDSFKCCICLSIMIKPVRMPCLHEVCLACFEGTIQSASLACPFCRKRLSVWLRRNKDINSLVYQEKWDRIQTLYPEYVAHKLQPPGTSSYVKSPNVSLDETVVVNRQMAEEGELFAEWQAAMRTYEDEARAEQEAEEAASMALIEQLELADSELDRPPTRRASPIKKKQTSLERFLLTHKPSSHGSLSTESVMDGDRLSFSSSLAADGSEDHVAAPPMQRTDSCLSDVILHNKLSLQPSYAEAYFLRCDSVDSIGPELNHFKPIIAMPLTPTRKDAGIVQPAPKPKPSTSSMITRASIRKPRRNSGKVLRSTSTSSRSSFKSPMQSARQSSLLEYTCSTVAPSNTTNEVFDFDFALKLQKQYDVAAKRRKVNQNN